ncbi:hypothetical protein P4S72_29425 [Vibrio sp. PP-XX7]
MQKNLFWRKRSSTRAAVHQSESGGVLFKVCLSLSRARRNRDLVADECLSRIGWRTSVG